MNSSRDVTLCKQAGFGVALANAGGKKRFDLDDRLQDAKR
jgi:hypothetical protein